MAFTVDDLRNQLRGSSLEDKISYLNGVPEFAEAHPEEQHAFLESLSEGGGEQHTEPKSAIDKPIKTKQTPVPQPESIHTDSAPASSENTEAPSLTLRKHVEQSKYLTPDEQRRFNELRKLGNNLSPSQVEEIDYYITKASPIPTDAEIKALPIRQNKPDFSQSPIGNVVLPPEQDATDGTGFPPTTKEEAADGKGQPAPAPQEPFAGFPQNPDRPLGQVPLEGLSVQRTSQPEQAEFNLPEPVKSQEVLPKVSSAPKQEEPRAEQNTPTEDSVDRLIREKSALDEQFLGTPRPGVLPQTAEATPQRRSEQVENKMEAAGLNERQKNILRGLQISDAQLSDLLDTIAQTKTAVGVTKQATRQVLGKVRR
jgi:hypothetical protein